MHKSPVASTKEADDTRVLVNKRDIIQAWMALEGLAVSLDRIGSTFAQTTDPQQRAALQETLLRYFADGATQSISDARMRLGRYLSDAEAESLSDQVVYWEYKVQKK